MQVWCYDLQLPCSDRHRFNGKKITITIDFIQIHFICNIVRHLITVHLIISQFQCSLSFSSVCLHFILVLLMSGSNKKFIIWHFNHHSVNMYQLHVHHYRSSIDNTRNQQGVCVCEQGSIQSFVFNDVKMVRGMSRWQNIFLNGVQINKCCIS